MLNVRGKYDAVIIALPSPNQNVALECRGLSPKIEEWPSWNMLVRLCYLHELCTSFKKHGEGCKQIIFDITCLFQIPQNLSSLIENDIGLRVHVAMSRLQGLANMFTTMKEHPIKVETLLRPLISRFLPRLVSNTSFRSVDVLGYFLVSGGSWKILTFFTQQHGTFFLKKKTHCIRAIRVGCLSLVWTLDFHPRIWYNDPCPQGQKPFGQVKNLPPYLGPMDLEERVLINIKGELLWCGSGLSCTCHMLFLLKLI